MRIHLVDSFNNTLDTIDTGEHNIVTHREIDYLGRMLFYHMKTNGTIHIIKCEDHSSCKEMHDDIIKREPY